MGIRKHIRLLSVLLGGLAGAGLLTVGLGLTPWSGSVFGSMFGIGPRGDFSLSSDSPLTVPQGQTGAISITVVSVNHLSGDVSITATLTTSASTPPTVNTSPPSVSLSADATISFSVTVTTTGSTTLGSYSISVQGKTSMVSHSITVSAQVTPPPPPPTPDFSLSSSTSYLTTSQGTSVATTLTVSSILSYTGTVALTAFVNPSGVNSPSVSLNRTSLLLPPGGSNTTGLTVNAFNATAGSYGISITGISGTHTHTLYIGLSVTQFVGFESLNLEFAVINSPTNATLNTRNTGSVTSNLVSYYVTDASGDKYTLASWNGPTISPNGLGVARILIGASCSSCVLTGSAFTFTPGNSYGITLVTRYNNHFTFTITLSNQESLSMDSFSFASGTNVSLYIRNTGNIPVQLVSYYVRDASGNQYTLSSYSGPTIPVSSVAPAYVTIGSACPRCTLTGAAFTFNAGFSYTITFVTSRNNQFTFVLTR